PRRHPRPRGPAGHLRELAQAVPTRLHVRQHALYGGCGGAPPFPRPGLGGTTRLGEGARRSPPHAPPKTPPPTNPPTPPRTPPAQPPPDQQRAHEPPPQSSRLLTTAADPQEQSH